MRAYNQNMPAKSKCDKLLRKHISKEMRAYKRGRFVSPQQAIAVAYAKTRKSKSCGKRWKLPKRSRSRAKRSPRRTTRRVKK